MKCKICGFETIELTGKHLKVHDIDIADYFIKYEYEGNVPKCKCGCNKDVLFNKRKRKFNIYLSHHEMLDKNNSKKHSEVMKGKIPWNKNLTKELDRRVAKYAQNRKGIKFSDEHIKNIGIARKRMFKNYPEKLKIVQDRMSSMAKNPINQQKRLNSWFNSLMVGNFKINTGFYHGKYKNEYYDSSYELGRFLQLEKLDKKFTKKHKIKIKYNLNGKEHLYIPDILVENNTIEEIKPSSRIKNEINKQKFLSIYEYCKENNFKFKIITEKHIGKKYLENAQYLHHELNQIKNYCKLCKKEIICRKGRMKRQFCSKSCASKAHNSKIKFLLNNIENK